ncbi:MAG: transglycosylase SLT domain-containing protein [Bdellovibrionaceae bacterium]|nr:transglycosylase SLT domain-containing protein [Bdellovibrionales bacterium]MCB9084197.1 transglycosylase SLT domain-containing protein [Pseudobdellovibrionaceae bacterium]
MPSVLVAAGTILALMGCVGPTTPFGGIHSLGVPGQTNLKAQIASEPEVARAQDAQGFYSPEPTKAHIRFNPDRQVLHGRHSFKVAIHDPRGISETSRWKIYFNGYDVTKQILPSMVSYLDEDQRTLNLEFPNLRVRPDRDNRIEVAFFHSDRSPPVIEEWMSPECSLYEHLKVNTTGRFDVSQQILTKIAAWSKEHEINPSLVTGLVAQESGFDPQAVSWAKAIGLTQVTPIGDLEISRYEPNWPRSEKINRLPAGLVKTMIQVGKITSKDDWRLDPELSIRGGLTLLEYFERYWRMKMNFSRLEATFPHPEEVFTPVVLASYHSGAARVKRAINESGRQFLDAVYLKEAKKYVNRVSSYCYHFAEREVSDESAP